MNTKEITMLARRFLHSMTPECVIQEAARRGWLRLHGETSLALSRRTREGFFELYCKGKGLDIGPAGDPLVANCATFELHNGDALFIDRYVSDAFDWIYASHVLEHMGNPGVALRNWWKLVKPGGFLILYVPERDLFEQKKQLPSDKSVTGEKKNYLPWFKALNPGQHKWFFTLKTDDPPDTIGLLPFISRILGSQCKLMAKVCGESGEHSIEAICKKRK